MEWVGYWVEMLIKYRGRAAINKDEPMAHLNFPDPSCLVYVHSKGLWPISCDVTNSVGRSVDYVHQITGTKTTLQ